MIRYVQATGDERVRARRSGSSCSWRRRGCGARSATTTPGPVPHRRRDRPRRVQRDRRQQRLHEPDGAAEPARRRRRVRAPPRARRASSASTPRRWRLARGRGRMLIPYDEQLGVHPQAEGFTDHEVWDFEGTEAGPISAAAALPVLRPLPQAGRQAGRPRARACHLAATPSPPSRRCATSTTTSGSRCVTRRCRRASRRCSPPECGHLRLAFDYAAEAALMDLAGPRAQHAPTGCTSASLAGSVAGLGRAGSAACAITRDGSSSRRGCPTG